MTRDFSAENPINIVMRAFRALLGRVRGRLYYCAGYFAKGSSPQIFFGRGVRFINPGLMRIDMGVAFGTNARLECFHQAGRQTDQPNLIIGAGTTFGDGLHVGSINRVEIGADVLVGSYVLIVDHSHGSPRKDLEKPVLIAPHDRPIISKAPITIGPGAWIGDGAVILAGACIGEGAVIGANAVVRGPVPPRSIYLGTN